MAVSQYFVCGGLPYDQPMQVLTGCVYTDGQKANPYWPMPFYSATSGPDHQDGM